MGKDDMMNILTGEFLAYLWTVVRYSEDGVTEDPRMMAAENQVKALLQFLIDTFSGEVYARKKAEVDGIVLSETTGRPWANANTTELLLLFYGFVDHAYDLGVSFDVSISNIWVRFDCEVRHENENKFADGNILKTICSDMKPQFYEMLVSKAGEWAKRY